MLIPLWQAIVAYALFFFSGVGAGLWIHGRVHRRRGEPGGTDLRIELIRENEALRQTVLGFVQRSYGTGEPPTAEDVRKLVDAMVPDDTPIELRIGTHMRCGTNWETWPPPKPAWERSDGDDD